MRLRRPDDWHLHLRDGAALRAVLPFSAARFARAIVMPNLTPPVTTTALALATAPHPGGAARGRALRAADDALSDRPDAAPRRSSARTRAAFVHGFKLYPAGATTHSDAGVTDVRRIEPVLARMAELGMPLQVHGEVTDPDVDVFDREARFIERVLAPLAERCRRCAIVFEHVTTRAAVDFVLGGRRGVAATITPQHLLMNRNALFAGGLRPHHYCLPVLKAEADRAALLAAVDTRRARACSSAPTARRTRARAKETRPAAAPGSSRAHAGIELYAEAFDAAGALERLEGFASLYGADFYGLPRNTGSLTLADEPWEVPAHYPFGDDELVPLRAGERIAWRLAGRT